MLPDHCKEFLFSKKNRCRGLKTALMPSVAAILHQMRLSLATGCFYQALAHKHERLAVTALASHLFRS